MRIPETLRTETAQHVFEAAFIVLVLVVLPWLPLGKYGGGIAMLAASLVGMIGYLVLYGERLRNRGHLKALGLSTVLGAVIAVVLALVITHWRRFV